MQQRLALALAAQQVARLAVALNLPHVAADRLPATDLAAVLVRHAAAHVVAAVPLEPAARIVVVDPALAPPLRQRLARVDAEEVECAVALTGRELRADEPALGEFPAAVGHVLAAEDPEAEHLARRELRLELGIEVAA